MTILRFNWIALILIYIGAITVGFLYDATLGWGITLYSLGSIIYYFIILNITKNKNEKSIKNSWVNRNNYTSILIISVSMVANGIIAVYSWNGGIVYNTLVRLPSNYNI